jgi:chromosome segregation ATPase
MSFDYEKLKKKQETGEQWASYSDLFMVLSVVFLLLYVVASLRTGTHTLQQQMQNQALAEKAQDLENQIKAYNNLKENYLDKSASDKEQQVYEQLMDKLTLLEDENKEEASALRKKAMENEKKEMALNQYQQIIRNIINSNVLSKSKIKRRDRRIASAEVTIADQQETIQIKDDTILERDGIIEEKETQISNLDKEVELKKSIIAKKNNVIAEKQRILKTKQVEIVKLNRDIAVKKGQIKTNKKKISKINRNLAKQIKSLKREQKRRKISKKNFLKKMAKIKAKSKKEINWLNRKNKKIKGKLYQVNKAVSTANVQLKKANKTIVSQKSQKEKLDRELNSVQSQKAALDAELTKVQSEVVATKAELEKTKSTFQQQVASLEGQKSTLEQQRNKLQNQKNLLKSQKKELKQINSKLAKVNTKLDKDKKQLTKVSKKLEKEKVKLAEEKTQLKTEKKQLSKDLKKAQEIINAKKSLAKQISKNFKKAGIEASVDPGTGEVVLAFGNSYFDNGKAHLKGSMKSTLNKFMPIYAESIFKDPKIASKIKSVDIIGFSSPTYAGRYVNPNSLAGKDKQAIEYNTNLSIERAKSVFKHIIDTDKLKYQRQNQITPLLKVSGRSYFSGALKGRAPAKEMSKKEFCSLYDCKKEQRVIIRFELDHR